jgi:hypothetical protein
MAWAEVTLSRTISLSRLSRRIAMVTAGAETPSQRDSAQRSPARLAPPLRRRLEIVLLEIVIFTGSPSVYRLLSLLD